MSSATKKPSQSKAAASGAQARASESVNTYIDRLMDGHERFAEAVGTVRARNIRVADKFIEAVLASQRETLAFSKGVAAEPTAYGKHTEAFLQSMATAQERALELAKTVFAEQTEAAAEARTMFEPLIASTKTFGKPFERMVEIYTQAAK